MDTIFDLVRAVVIFVEQNSFAQYFLMGALGSFFFDMTLYFNKNLGLLAKRKGVRQSARFSAVFVVCQTMYASTLGGLMAIWIDRALWLAFFVGFMHSIFFIFLVRTLLLNSTKKAFWFTIGKLLANILLSPTRKFLVLLESLTPTNETKK